MYERLNEDQQLAVSHDDGPMLVVAGAGTGKTAVITSRIARLIKEGKARPAEILALTFTDKAAREMADRLHGMIGWDSFQVPIMTFNSFGSNILAQYSHHIGRSVRGGLLNDTQKTILLQQNLAEIKLSYYGGQIRVFDFLAGIVSFIGEMQNSGISSEDYAAYVQQLKLNPGDRHPLEIAEEEDIALIYSHYDSLKQRTGTIDFNDQLGLSLKILQQKPNVASQLSRRYRYILVDEYQDTNTVQDSVLRAIVPSDGNIFAVGDDDQAIYGFRGAKVQNILDFNDHFGLVKPVVLTQNYRSGQEILDASYRLIQNNNPDRLEEKLNLDKRLKAQSEGSIVDFIPYPSAQDEVKSVAEEICRLIKNSEAPSSIAVLSATHAPLKRLAKELRQADVPFALSTQSDIFEQTELKQLWYLLKWLNIDASNDEIAHILLGPFFRLSGQDYRQLKYASTGEAMPVEDVLRVQAQENESLLKVVAALEKWRGWAQELPVSQLVYKLVFESGLSNRLIGEAEESNRAVRVFEDLETLLTQMLDYESVALSPILSSYLEVFPQPPQIEVSEPVGEEEGVQLLTVHSSKGLEFNTVFLISCTHSAWSVGGNSGQREIPEQLKPVRDQEPEQEYRRLMYVAVTRAKSKLLISAPCFTAGGRKQKISRYIEELFDKPLRSVGSLVVKNRAEEAVNKIQKLQPLVAVQASERLPFEKSDGWIELSVGDLDSYRRCPYDFFLHKVLKIQEPFGPQLAFGTALHKAFEGYYDAKLQKEEVSLEALLARLDESWSDRGYPSHDVARQEHEKAHDTVRHFFAREEMQQERRILGSETPVTLEIPEAKLRLRGRVDAYFDTSEGLEIRDFKTGRKTDKEKLAAAAKDSFQLRTYALAFEELSGKTPDVVTLDYVVTGTEGSAKLTPLILKNHRDKLIQLAEAIRRREFEASKDRHDCAKIKYYGEEEE